MDTLDELAHAFAALTLPKQAWLRYWSRDLLLSSDARARWTEPDLRLLDVTSLLEW